MATPSPEMMKSLMANPAFQEALRDQARGYRWKWCRVSGNRWVVEREPVDWIAKTAWDWVPAGKTTSTVRIPYPVSK